MHFLKIYFEILNPPKPVRILSTYLTDLLLLSVNSIKFEPSMIASAILFTSYLTLNEMPDVSFNFDFVRMKKNQNYKNSLENGMILRSLLMLFNM
jgi:hypothetical protein